MLESARHQDFDGYVFMSYGRLKSALDLYKVVVETRPDLAEKATVLKDHYLAGNPTKPTPYYFLYGTLRLLLGDDCQKATGAMGQAMQMHVLNAEKSLTDAVNLGPAFLKEDEEFLHAKGIMRGGTKYFFSSGNIKPGSLYDRAWTAMDKAYRPIIAAAIEGSLKKDKIIGTKVMQYVAASLMPDALKVQELKGLAVKYNGEHQDLLKEALLFIGNVAEQNNIALPPLMLTAASAAASFGKATDGNASAPLPPAPPPPPTPPPPPPPSPAPAKEEGGSVLRDDFVQGSAPAPQKPYDPVARFAASTETDAEREMKALKRDLGVLRKNKDISEREMGVYLWLKMPNKDGSERGLTEAATLLTKNGDKKVERGHVRLMVANVNVKLRALHGGQSDGDLHQYTMLRPQ